MASRPTIDETTLEQFWLNAALGLKADDLSRAIATAKQSRAMFDNPTERFGFYSIQRTLQTFLEEAGVREEKVPNGPR